MSNNSSQRNLKIQRNRRIFPFDCRFLEHILCLWTTLVLIVLSPDASLMDGASLLMICSNVLAILIEEYLVVPSGTRLLVYEPREALSHGLATGSCLVPWVLWNSLHGDSGVLYVQSVLSSIAILFFICVHYCHHANDGKFPKVVAGIALLIYLVLDMSIGHQDSYIVSSMLSIALFYGIIIYLPRTCTLGESIALSSTVVQLLWGTCLMMWIECDAMSMFIQSTLSLGVVFFMVGFISISMYHRGNKIGFWLYGVALISILIFLGGYICCAVVPVVNAYVQDGYRTNTTRMSLVLYWMIIMTLSLPLMATLKNRKSFVPNTIQRKGFHLVALLLFVPSLILDAGLLAMALTVAFIGFIVLEIIRIGNIRILRGVEDHIHRFMASFIDSRDQGELYMTHMTLLLGLAVPIWISRPYNHDNEPNLMLLSFAGIIATGVGDAMASIVGTLYGTIRIADKTSKTLQGTCASIGSMLLCWYLVDTCIINIDPLSNTDWIWLSCMTAASALFESITDQFDNVFVSVHYYALLRCFLMQTQT